MGHGSDRWRPDESSPPSCWSAQFRSILGLSTSDDFPNVLDNWASRIHPQDKQEVISLFAAHLANRSGEEAVRGDLPDQAEKRP